MAGYRLLPTYRAALLRRLLTSTVPVMLLVMVVVFGLSVARGQTAGLLVSVPVVAAAVGFVLYKAYRRQLRQLGTFEIRISGDQLTRSMDGVQPLTLHRGEVARIEEHATGELTVHAEEKSRSVRIPAAMERRDELLAELAAWQTIEPGGSVRASTHSTLVAVAVVLAFGITIASPNPLVVAVVGSLLFATVVTSLVLIARNAQLPASTRRLSWIGIIPALAILSRVLNALRQLGSG